MTFAFSVPGTTTFLNPKIGNDLDVRLPSERQAGA
jgi:hypothetical protein